MVDWIGRSLWLSWYKSRGCTEAMFLLSEKEARKPKRDEVRAIADYLDECAAKQASS
jgi:hypothetical protein